MPTRWPGGVPFLKQRDDVISRAFYKMQEALKWSRLPIQPGDRCVETKSLKFYLASFRNEPAFNEEIVNRILDDLVAACEPRQMNVTGRFGSRGGISLTVRAGFPEAQT